MLRLPSNVYPHFQQLSVLSLVLSTVLWHCCLNSCWKSSKLSNTPRNQSPENFLLISMLIRTTKHTQTKNQTKPKIKQEQRKGKKKRQDIQTRRLEKHLNHTEAQTIHLAKSFNKRKHKVIKHSTTNFQLLSNLHLPRSTACIF